MRLFVSLGHATPAISFVQACPPSDQIFLITRRSNSAEAELAASLNLKAIPLNEWKFNRVKKWQTLIRFPYFIFSLLQSLQAILKYKPDRVICFGSYVSVPIGLAASLLRVPLILHEQTTTAGLANQILSPFAQHIFVSYQSSLQYFKSSKTTVIGNLIRPEFFAPNLPQPDWVKNTNQKPVLYITGGSQGSQILNAAIINLYPQLTKQYYTIHQLGQTSTQPALSGNQGVVRSNLMAAEVAWAMRHAKIIISRAGANTISETMACGTPAILVPLPIAAKNEQLRNAQMIATLKAGVTLPQNKLSPAAIEAALNTINNSYETFVKHAKALSKLTNPNAAHELYQFVSKDYQAK